MAKEVLVRISNKDLYPDGDDENIALTFYKDGTYHIIVNDIMAEWKILGDTMVVKLPPKYPGEPERAWLDCRRSEHGRRATRIVKTALENLIDEVILKEASVDQR